MSIIRMNEIQGEKNKYGFTAKTLVSHQNATVKNILIKNGDIIPEHSVPVDVFFYVVKGKGTIYINKEAFEVEDTDIVICPQNTEMSVSANRNSDFSFLNVKTPSL
ncbi:MAG: cupin domain-containing protein [Firmicutes bacterium]|nr:cupin domain-containing protein [Bacillota bacterium]